VEDLEKLEQIRKNLEYLETWFDHSTDAIYITDDEGRILFINAEAQKRIGSEPDDLIGTSINEIEPVFENIEDWKAHIAHLRHVGSMIIEGMSKTDGGSIFPVEATMTYRESDDKSYVVCFIRNISDRKKAELEMRTTLDLVSEQNKRLLNFNFIVSHNIRSHASNIQGLSDLLVTSVNEEERNHLKKLLRIASGNLMTTIDDLNKVVTIQRNINIERSEIKVLDSINNILSMLRGELHHNNVQVDIQIDAEDRICFNSEYFDSILLNLMSNAIRYKNPGIRPSIRLKSTQFDDSLVLEIADNGLGIDLSRYGDKLFTMYKTFHGNSDARGLGLFITKNQIEALGGKIDVESKPSEGSTFRVTFPCNN
jgi:PAS domain S-box-containing protein